MRMENNANNRVPKHAASKLRRRMNSRKEIIAPRRPVGRRSAKRTRINAIDPSGCDSSTSSCSEPGAQDKRQHPPCEDNNEMDRNVDDQDGHLCQSGHDDDDDDDNGNGNDNDNDNDEDVTSEDENIDPGGRGGKSDGRDHMHESLVDKNLAGDTTPGVRVLLRQPFPAVELARARGKR
jgi:hypothetical protein